MSIHCLALRESIASNYQKENPMNINFIKSSILGALALASSVTFAAAVTDVKEFSNNQSGEYFVIDDASKYNSPYYRESYEDWGWQHGAIAGSFSSIILNISAFDVDYGASTYYEHDEISVWDGSSWFSLGELDGASDIWAFTNFDLSSYSWAQAQVNAGLKVAINIDKYNSGWLVTLGKSTLTTDGGSQQCVPTPGIPCTPTSVPEPSGLMLLGLGILGLALARRRTAK
jgi:hypothetical protein